MTCRKFYISAVLNVRKERRHLYATLVFLI